MNLAPALTDAAYANDTRVSTGTSNCLSVLGPLQGGGLSRTMGLYGLGVDQLISVTASGDIVRVDDRNPELWWALRGAAPNFGIVTSATIRTYPVPAADNIAWTGFLTFDSDKIEDVVGAINNLDLEPQMEIDFYYATTGSPDYIPSVIIVPFYVGSASAGRAAFE